MNKIYRCATCKNPLQLASTGVENQRPGHDNFDAIFYFEPCNPCLDNAHGDGYNEGLSGQNEEL